MESPEIQKVLIASMRARSCDFFACTIFHRREVQALFFISGSKIRELKNDLYHYGWESSTMLDSLIAIKLILRYGTIGAVVLAILISFGTACVFWSSIGWFAIALALLVGALALLIGKSYVELVSIVFQMMH